MWPPRVQEATFPITGPEAGVDKPGLAQVPATGGKVFVGGVELLSQDLTRA